MGKHLKDFFSLLKDVIKQWQKDKASRLAAALAYYTIFSPAPLLIIVIAIAGIIFDEEAARGEIVAQIEDMVGRDGAEIIQTAIQNASKPGASIPATIIGVITLLVGAAGVFGQLQDALNTIWGVEPKPSKGGAQSVLRYVQKRFISFGMVIGSGFLLMVSLVLSAILSAAMNYIEARFPGIGILSQLLNIVISFAVITALFAMIYKVLPDVELSWGDVILGAAVTALLFSIGKYLIGLYLGQSSAASTYGAAGSLVVLLLWIYYSAQLVFFGAEFTQVYTTRKREVVKPEGIAEVADPAKVGQPNAPLPAYFNEPASPPFVHPGSKPAIKGGINFRSVLPVIWMYGTMVIANWVSRRVKMPGSDSKN